MTLGEFIAAWERRGAHVYVRKDLKVSGVHPRILYYGRSIVPLPRLGDDEVLTPAHIDHLEYLLADD